MSIQRNIFLQRTGLLKTNVTNEDVELQEKVLDDLGTTKGTYTVSSKVHQHPDEEHYNTNTVIHKGTINGKKFEAHSHINRGLSFITKHDDDEKSAIKNHLKKNKYL
jgi:poly-beta-hydroxyalkanoate depolymerase